MKLYVFPLVFLVALSVSSVGEALAGDEAKAKRKIATPSSDTKVPQSLTGIVSPCDLVALKSNEKLVLKGGDYIVAPPNGAIQLFGKNGKVKRTFRQGEIHKDPKGKVFILTKTKKVGVGRYKGIEAIKPGKDAPTGDAETSRQVISPGGIGQVREGLRVRDQKLVEVPEGIVLRGNILEAKEGYELEQTSPNKGNIVYMMSPGGPQSKGTWSCECCATAKCTGTGCSTKNLPDGLQCNTTSCSATCQFITTTEGLGGNRLSPE